mmetsp:Transcript_15424/g.35786  ORF Transcript_15424/g.35786 Transcript_15424/m.35786 type:complete len:487 (-) Transcript_15424:562-2022(-)
MRSDSSCLRARTRAAAALAAAVGSIHASSLSLPLSDTLPSLDPPAPSSESKTPSSISARHCRRCFDSRFRRRRRSRTAAAAPFSPPPAAIASAAAVSASSSSSRARTRSFAAFRWAPATLSEAARRCFASSSSRAAASFAASSACRCCNTCLRFATRTRFAASAAASAAAGSVQLVPSPARVLQTEPSAPVCTTSSLGPDAPAPALPGLATICSASFLASASCCLRSRTRRCASFCAAECSTWPVPRPLLTTSRPSRVGDDGSEPCNLVLASASALSSTCHACSNSSFLSPAFARRSAILCRASALAALAFTSLRTAASAAACSAATSASASARLARFRSATRLAVRSRPARTRTISSRSSSCSPTQARRTAVPPRLPLLVVGTVWSVFCFNALLTLPVPPLLGGAAVLFGPLCAEANDTRRTGLGTSVAGVSADAEGQGDDKDGAGESTGESARSHGNSTPALPPSTKMCPSAPPSIGSPSSLKS